MSFPRSERPSYFTVNQLQCSSIDLHELERHNRDQVVIDLAKLFPDVGGAHVHAFLEPSESKKRPVFMVAVANERGKSCYMLIFQLVQEIEKVLDIVDPYPDLNVTVLWCLHDMLVQALEPLSNSDTALTMEEVLTGAVHFEAMNSETSYVESSTSKCRVHIEAGNLMKDVEFPASAHYLASMDVLHTSNETYDLVTFTITTGPSLSLANTILPTITKAIGICRNLDIELPMLDSLYHRMKSLTQRDLEQKASQIIWNFEPPIISVSNKNRLYDLDDQIRWQLWTDFSPQRTPSEREAEQLVRTAEVMDELTDLAQELYAAENDVIKKIELKNKIVLLLTSFKKENSYIPKVLFKELQYQVDTHQPQKLARFPQLVLPGISFHTADGVVYKYILDVDDAVKTDWKDQEGFMYRCISEFTELPQQQPQPTTFFSKLRSTVASIFR